MGVRKARGNDTFDFTAFVLHETTNAFLLSEKDPAALKPGERNEGQWFPKSCTEKGNRVGPGCYEFTTEEWLAVQKGFA